MRTKVFSQTSTSYRFASSLHFRNPNVQGGVEVFLRSWSSVGVGGSSRQVLLELVLLTRCRRHLVNVTSGFNVPGT